MRLDLAIGLSIIVSGWGAQFASAVHVTIAGSELSAGGYWLDLRSSDGDQIEGVQRRCVEFAPGTQDVTLIVERSGFFVGGSSRVVRLVVDAVTQRDQPIVARGSAVLELERGAVTETRVSLVADPRPFTAGLTASIRSSAGWIEIAPSSPPEGSGFVFDLWLDGDDRLWLGRLSTGVVNLDLDAQRERVAERGLRLLVTAEPESSPEPLKRSVGWPLLRGELHPAFVATLITVPAAVGCRGPAATPDWC